MQEALLSLGSWVDSHGQEERILSWFRWSRLLHSSRRLSRGMAAACAKVTKYDTLKDFRQVSDEMLVPGNPQKSVLSLAQDTNTSVTRMTNEVLFVRNEGETGHSIHLVVL